MSKFLETLGAVILCVGLYALPGWFMAEVLSGLTYGGLPPDDYYQIMWTWPMWLLRICGI